MSVADDAHDRSSERTAVVDAGGETRPSTLPRTTRARRSLEIAEGGSYSCFTTISPRRPSTGDDVSRSRTVELSTIQRASRTVSRLARRRRPRDHARRGANPRSQRRSRRWPLGGGYSSAAPRSRRRGKSFRSRADSSQPPKDRYVVLGSRAIKTGHAELRTSRFTLLLGSDSASRAASTAHLVQLFESVGSHARNSAKAAGSAKKSFLEGAHPW